MGRYLLVRSFESLATLLVISLVVFVLARATGDPVTLVIAVLGQSVPSFWLAIMLIFVFSVLLRLLPTSGMGSLDHYVLPVVVLTFLALPLRTRLMRSSMLEILDTEYIKLARAKGL